MIMSLIYSKQRLVLPTVLTCPFALILFSERGGVSSTSINALFLGNYRQLIQEARVNIVAVVRLFLSKVFRDHFDTHLCHASFIRHNLSYCLLIRLHHVGNHPNTQTSTFLQNFINFLNVFFSSCIHMSGR